MNIFLFFTRCHCDEKFSLLFFGISLKCIAHESSRREVAEKDRILRRGCKVLHMKSVYLFTSTRTTIKENVVTHSRGKNFFLSKSAKQFQGDNDGRRVEVYVRLFFKWSLRRSFRKFSDMLNKYSIFTEKRRQKFNHP